MKAQDHARPPRRRAHPRTEFVLKVEYHHRKDLLTDYIKDLAHGGLFICTTIPFAVNQTIHLILSFPGLLEPLPLTGTVRWRHPPDPDRPDDPPGVGVEFVDLSADQRQQIASLLAKEWPRSKATTPERARPFRVLLAEDNTHAAELFLHGVKRFCHAKDLEILVARTGQEALEKTEGKEIDFALIDYFLPVLNGAELVRALRKRLKFGKTPMLVVSVPSEGVREEALRAGADLYLQKPVLRKQLLSTLGLLIKRDQPPVSPEPSRSVSEERSRP